MVEELFEEIGAKVAAAIPVAIDAYDVEEMRILRLIYEQIVIPYQITSVYTWDLGSQLQEVQYNPVTGILLQPVQNLAGWKPLDAMTPNLLKAAQAMRFMIDHKGQEGTTLFVFRDAAALLKSPENILGQPVSLPRRLQDLCNEFVQSGKRKGDLGVKRVLFLGQDISLSSELSRLITKVNVPLPSAEDIRAEIEAQAALYAADPEFAGFVSPAPDDEHLWLKLIRSAQGLTEHQIIDVIRQVVYSDECIGATTADAFYEHKKQVLKELGLEIVEPTKQKIGGLNEVRRWLNERAQLFNAEEDDDVLRGMLILGIPGTGKSLLAELTGSLLQAPVFSLQADNIYGRYVGDSENNARRILRSLEAIAPAVLWIDEIDKFFASGEGDHVGKKVLGIFLNWMQRRDKPVFVVATANNIGGLPAELLRKGRFDEIFFVDLPDEEDRAEILSIHLSKRGTMLTSNDVALLAQKIAAITNDFSGSELAELVKVADFASRTRGKKGLILLEDLEEEVERTQPLAIQMKSQIDAMRDRAKLSFRAATMKNTTVAGRGDRSTGSRVIKTRTL